MTSHRAHHAQPIIEPADADGGSWISRQVSALAEAWRRGERITAEEMIAQHPGLDVEASIRLIYEELCLRREAGEAVDAAELKARFPAWQDELDLLLGCDSLLQPCGSAVFPAVGESLGAFRLLAVLGQGASGRTYLASESALADRPVALKVIPGDLDEHLTLARLQHTHIVPLFSEHLFPERGLRTLCMPYLGGAGLDQILADLAPIAPRMRRGRHLLETIDQSSHSEAADSPYRSFMDQATYVQTICWIGACLADALQHAHDRGLVHMDLKPSNVLIAADGQPMLLDFHLARGPVARGDFIADRLGGTPGWMSPEQAAAMEAVAAGRPLASAVDGRSDIYALGLLLRGALAGPDAAADGDRTTAWLERNPHVSPGLADLISKCLEPDPARRYRTAAALADDLRRHLNDLPLRGVPNRSPRERWRKWRRRSPGALARAWAWTCVVVALTIAAGLAARGDRHRLEEARAALQDGEALSARQQYAEAVRTLKRGLTRASAWPASHRLAQRLTEQLRLAQLGREAEDLHALADLIRFHHGMTLPVPDEAAALLGRIQIVLNHRSALLEASQASADSGLQQQIIIDLRELAIIAAELHARLGEPRRALELLSEAESLLGSTSALDRRRRALCEALNLSPPPARTPAASQSVWDHYDLGRQHLRSGDFGAAAHEFALVIAARPQDFWSNFYQGLCAYQLTQFDESIAAFRTCIALNPRAAVCFYNRGLAHEANHNADAACADYTQAIRLDASLVSARMNRGVLLYRQGRLDAALADLERSLGLAADAETRSEIHYNMALVYQAQGDGTSAMFHAQQARSPEGRALVDRLAGKQ